ncbi:hypothetical protein L6164_007832 [Bauhinia variegata]|uniref:Uncharacterized protein n=1 Tax=Bauhinia variegata TaxID=167791 RepID=A0ACB9PE02_BAUVA|nr:hypothetical protein L6164_007832 [Bauhinia variegata]
MAKFNVVQKKRRALIAEKKRQIHGDPSTGKLKTKRESLSVSGKRKRKLFRKWRREQKEALEKGLVSMEDVEMAVAEGESQKSSKPSTKIHLKKSLKLKQLKRKGNKNKRKSAVPAVDVAADAMVE